jgi:hypothetical protein
MYFTKYNDTIDNIIKIIKIMYITSRIFYIEINPITILNIITDIFIINRFPANVYIPPPYTFEHIIVNILFPYIKVAPEKKPVIKDMEVV